MVELKMAEVITNCFLFFSLSQQTNSLDSYWEGSHFSNQNSRLGLVTENLIIITDQLVMTPSWFQLAKVNLVYLLWSWIFWHIHSPQYQQGRWKQSVDGQAQRGKAANKLHSAKFFKLAIYSSQEALSLHFTQKSNFCLNFGWEWLDQPDWFRRLWPVCYM